MENFSTLNFKNHSIQDMLNEVYAIEKEFLIADYELNQIFKAKTVRVPQKVVDKLTEKIKSIHLQRLN